MRDEMQPAEQDTMLVGKVINGSACVDETEGITDVTICLNILRTLVDQKSSLAQRRHLARLCHLNRELINMYEEGGGVDNSRKQDHN